MSASAQRRLAGFAASCLHDAIPESARDIARQSLLDTLAVAFAGRGEAVVARAFDYAGAATREGGPAAWLTGAAHAPETTALLNGVAAHALDYDDVTPAWRGHPGAVIWPAILAAAHGREAVVIGDLLDAFVVGFEVGAQIGACVTAHHYSAGWHATATIGVIAASAGCARVLGMDAERTFDAIGLAIAQAGGVQANFGSMAKPLQAGFAASSGLRAACLAAAGVDAGDALEGPCGFAHLYGGRRDIPIALPTRSDPTFAIVRTGIEVKQFPNCYATHRAVEAALRLRPDVDAHRIRGIDIEGTPAAHKPLLARLPSTVDEARFSAEFGVACALLDGELRFSSFSPDNLRRDDVQRLMAASRVAESDALGPKRAARVTVHLANDRRMTQTIVELPGVFGDATFMRRLRAKVDDCLDEAGLAGLGAELYEAVLAHPSDAAWAPGGGDRDVFDRIWRAAVGRERRS